MYSRHRGIVRLYPLPGVNNTGSAREGWKLRLVCLLSRVNVERGGIRRGGGDVPGPLSGGERTEGNTLEVTPDRYQVSQN